jgi:hypothetical protein
MKVLRKFGLALLALSNLALLASCGQQVIQAEAQAAAIRACNNFTNNLKRVDRFFNPCRVYLRMLQSMSVSNNSPFFPYLLRLLP